MSGATARLQLPYPTGGDTPDVPRDVLALATRLETVIEPTSLALPAAPVDGQVAYLALAGGGAWAFRWNAGSASAYKWEFCGGPPLYADQSAALNIASSTASVWVDDAGQPALTVPRAGEFVVQLGATFSVTSAGGATLTSDAWYTPPAGSLTDAGMACTVVINQNVVMTGSRQRRIAFAVANSVLIHRSAIGTAAAAVSISSRYLALTPIRVA
jgi:hypothetical protein